MTFVKCGIHTRIQNVINNKTNGIDRKKRVEYIKEKYNLSQEEAELIFTKDVDNLVTKYTLEQIIQSERDKKKYLHAKYGLMIGSIMNNL